MELILAQKMNLNNNMIGAYLLLCSKPKCIVDDIFNYMHDWRYLFPLDHACGASSTIITNREDQIKYCEQQREQEKKYMNVYIVCDGRIAQNKHNQLNKRYNKTKETTASKKKIKKYINRRMEQAEIQNIYKQTLYFSWHLHIN